MEYMGRVVLTMRVIVCLNYRIREERRDGISVESKEHVSILTWRRAGRWPGTWMGMHDNSEPVMLHQPRDNYNVQYYGRGSRC